MVTLVKTGERPTIDPEQRHLSVQTVEFVEIDERPEDAIGKAVCRDGPAVHHLAGIKARSHRCICRGGHVHSAASANGVGTVSQAGLAGTT